MRAHSRTHTHTHSFDRFMYAQTSSSHALISQPVNQICWRRLLSHNLDVTSWCYFLMSVLFTYYYLSIQMCFIWFCFFALKAANNMKSITQKGTLQPLHVLDCSCWSASSVLLYSTSLNVLMVQDVLSLSPLTLSFFFTSQGTKRERTRGKMRR